MFFNAAILSILFAVSPAVEGSFPKVRKNSGNIAATSPLGSKLLSSARRLEAGDDDAADDMTWVADYSIKFQGCHHSLQYNMNDDDDEDASKVYMKRLVRFSLCPSDSCEDYESEACEGSGEYIVDLATFVDAYTEAKMDAKEYACEQVQENCACDDDAVDDEACMQSCYDSAGLEGCEDDEFEVRNYLQCAQYDGGNGDDDGGNRRKLDEEAAYYIGPYCSDQGGAVYLGLFTDNTCTTAADESFNNLSGQDLPYSETSIVELDCVSCKEPQYNQNDGDQQDEDDIREMCENLYETAGKCETYLNANGKSSENVEGGCSYIDGIKIVRNDGTIITYEASRESQGATIAIGVLSILFVLLGAYSVYLKQKLSRAQVQLP